MPGGGLVNASETSAVSPIPDRLHTVTPRLVVRDGAAAIAFYGRAFGAEELGDRFTGPDGELIHAEIQIGASVVIFPLDDQFDGERGGRLRDPFGQQWMMSQHIEDVSAEEMSRRAAALYGDHA